MSTPQERKPEGRSTCCRARRTETTVHRKGNQIRQTNSQEQELLSELDSLKSTLQKRDTEVKALTEELQALDAFATQLQAYCANQERRNEAEARQQACTTK